MSNIDLVTFQNNFSTFMYTEDEGYKQLSEHYKHYKLSQHIEDLKNNRKPNSREIISSDWLESTKLFKILIKNYWEKSIDFSIIDVGCQYGIFSMDLATFIKKNDHKNLVYAFDCGIAADLCPYNIKLNLLDDMIVFEKRAISNFSIPHQVFFDITHSEDNHIIQRGSWDKLSSYVVDAVTLDDYFANHDENFIIKIDTQGVEPLVFQGMKRLLKKNPVIYFEFTPDIIESLAINSLTFLESIPRNYVLFIFDPHSLKIYKISRESLGKFVKSFLGTGRWTDILMIPNTMPGFEKIITEIQESQNFEEFKN